MAKPNPKKLLAALHDVARAASIMFDGELCGQIVTERSWKWMRDFDPDDVWSAHDNYDVEHEPFVAAKKSLLRLQMLAADGVRAACSLWLPVPTLPGQVTCVIQNGGPARWHRFGHNHRPVPPAMQQARGSGGPAEVDPEGGDVLTVVAPVRDSLKQIVGFIEVSASLSEPAINW